MKDTTRSLPVYNVGQAVLFEHEGVNRRGVVVKDLGASVVVDWTRPPTRAVSRLTVRKGRVASCAG